MSARDTEDFLRLAGELAEIVAASGANFLETVAAGEEFFFSEDRFAPIFFRSARSVSSCDRNSTPIEIGANFSFFSRAKAIFPFKPESSTPIAIGAFSFKRDLFNLSKYHFHKRIKLGSWLFFQCLPHQVPS